jgi:rhodanese-related sulfurtransferase
MAHSEEFLKLAAEAKSRIRQMAPEDVELAIRTGRAVVLDVREKEEYEQKRVPFALHLSRGVLEMRIHEVVPDKMAAVICYCSGGNRGALAADTLLRMGYVNVVSIEGGLSAWEAAGKPTEK